jgi:hypothetical protein
VDPTEQVSKLINCLTNDEDQRQDLWVHYLSGNHPSTFASYLKNIDTEYEDMQTRLWHAFKYPSSDKFYLLLDSLSDVERSIACLLALGLTVKQISEYKYISEIRIRQVMAVIKDSACWEELYGTQDETDRRRTLRLK